MAAHYTPREYAQGMIHPCKATSVRTFVDQLLHIRENIDPSLRRDVPVYANRTGLQGQTPSR
ncbi:hypothetical protein N7535_006537 [Penicillium sp. DV-2018c]|nr:hypothetical protein N7461_007378 [Penicillium sp. DV-2018c]KAJ5567231.1 hypothetical protein N7535_006537 [Penicillium sp. DV-2018c]